MAYSGDCFLVPGPVRMNDACLQAMATPVMTARGPEFQQGHGWTEFWAPLRLQLSHRPLLR